MGTALEAAGLRREGPLWSSGTRYTARHQAIDQDDDAMAPCWERSQWDSLALWRYGVERSASPEAAGGNKSFRQPSVHTEHAPPKLIFRNTAFGLTQKT